MWDLIVSVPDHCLSFYLLFPRLLIMMSQSAPMMKFQMCVPKKRTHFYPAG